MTPEAARRLQQLADQNKGQLDTDTIIRDARRKDSPLHGFFEWDQKKAHAIYLRERARDLIRTWYVVLESERSKRPNRVRAMVSLPVERSTDRGPQPRAYFLTEKVMKDPPRRNLLLQEALRDLRAIKAKYAALQELAEVMTVIDRAISTSGDDDLADAA